jgi:hypothetical protein
VKARFKLSKKLVAVVRYYETMYMISDQQGERIYTGNDEKTANAVLRILNGRAVRERKKRR